MFNIIWEFIINLLESFLFAVICNAKFTKRQYHYHTAEQTLFIRVINSDLHSMNNVCSAV